MTEPPHTIDSLGGPTELDEAYCSACNQSYPATMKVCPADGARLIHLAAQRDDLIGRVLDERYEIRAPLGKGGMGTVYRGWQLSVDREVAIKVIHPKLSDDRSAVKRFLREARLASRLSQPNIVNVYDFGQSAGVLYLVMELLRGHTLSTEVANLKRMHPKRVVTIALQLCDALEAAHAQGIVHRDLKPSNIIILDDPPGRDLIKVLDFGLAKSFVHDTGSVVTNTDALLGTPLYMAPEQIEGRDSDQRVDLYALGCILYEMLSGAPPFVDAMVSAILARHVNDAPDSLPAHVPPPLGALVERMLAKQPEARVQTAAEVRKVLEIVREMPGLAEATPPSAPEARRRPSTDSSQALAATHAATPTPVGVVIAPPAPVAQPAQGGAKPRRYAIVAFFAIIPLGMVAFVMFRNSATAPREPGGTQLDNAKADPGSGVYDAIPPMPTIDAGVEPSTALVDAAVDAAVDAPRVKKPDRRDRRDRIRNAPKRDAGVAHEPEIDFLPSKR